MGKRGDDRSIIEIRAFNRFYTRLLGLLDETLLDSPVSLTEARVLWEIRARPLSRAEDLITALSVDRGYLSRILRRLEREGLVSRSPHGTDGRIRVLTLTRSGTTFMRRLDAMASSQISRMIAVLSAGQRERLVSAMEDIQALLSSAHLRASTPAPMMERNEGRHPGP